MIDVSLEFDHLDKEVAVLRRRLGRGIYIQIKAPECRELKTVSIEGGKLLADIALDNGELLGIEIPETSEVQVLCL